MASTTLLEFQDNMNALGRSKVPFLFVIDFELQRPVLIPLADIDPTQILYNVNGVSNVRISDHPTQDISLKKLPIDIDSYKEKFDEVISHLEYGDSFLTNLTIKTEVNLGGSLSQVFQTTHARYKLLMEDSFLVFSPEKFVEISNGEIRSFPMKGTINAAIPNAKSKILADQKELSEHVTIVDLIRNDLSQVAENVRVDRFRYVEEVRTSDKTLLQVSSMITGTLTQDYFSRLGDLFVALLPAGSVTGAPKAKTLEIIRQVEKEPRGYYTGVFGIFDGERVDSGVMIRFIEKVSDKYFYRSGGGITTQSVLDMEYQEIIDKVYVPLA
ncbi:MAG: aminodeoxychorismate synthase component I [Chryseolinea sp.]